MLDGDWSSDVCSSDLIAALNTLSIESGQKTRFVPSTGTLSAFEYERGILNTGVIPTRPDNMHDFMNALVWLRFPLLKSALNRAHCEALAHNPHEATHRSPHRDALTVLDESGVLVFSRDPDFDHLLAGRRWKTLFVDRRMETLEKNRYYVVGHAILEKLLAPYPSITGKCLVLDGEPVTPDQADHSASEAISTIIRPKQLPPLPIAGIPGWDPGNRNPAFYDDTTIFRPPVH
jgi:hypothetical protein